MRPAGRFHGGIAMNLVAIKPIYLRGEVVTEGSVFTTDEQHGRELRQKGYARADAAGEAPEAPAPTKKARKNAGT